MTVTIEQIKSKLNEHKLQILNEFDELVRKKIGSENDSKAMERTWEAFTNGYIRHINSMNGYFVGCSHAVNYSQDFRECGYLMYLETWMYKETIYPILEQAMKEAIKELQP